MASESCKFVELRHELHQYYLWGPHHQQDRDQMGVFHCGSYNAPPRICVLCKRSIRRRLVPPSIQCTIITHPYKGNILMGPGYQRSSGWASLRQ